MLIRKKRIRNAASYLEALPPWARFRPAAIIDEALAGKLPSLGFREPIEPGATVLPAEVGPATRFNAQGGWQVHRDRPKEERYIRTVSWTWKQWAGRGQLEEHHENRDIYRQCYPRTRIPAPALELTVLEHAGERFLVGPILRNDPDHHDDVRHAINMILEVAGACELRQADVGAFAAPPVRRVNWAMLPPGRHPFERINHHLDAVLRRSGDNTRRVVRDRQEAILAHGPSEMHVGLGGFRDYVAYVFADRGLVVLECIRKGNALHVFGHDWKGVARLTKAEILDQGLHLERIVHSKGWRKRLTRVLDRRAIA